MSERTPIWSGLTEEEHEFQYNPQRAFPNFAEYRVLREPANQAARTSLRMAADIAYGDHPLRKVDIFPAERTGDALSPVHMFFHGGYWRAQDKEAFSFIAGALVAHGITTVIVNYELCPQSTLDAGADSAICAVEWTHRHIGEYGGDPNRVSLSGHSAGAHLGAEILAVDWRARGIDPSFIRGAVLISGIYDPEPAMRTTVNQQLRLTPEIVRRRDVERRTPLVQCPVTIYVGGLEPWQWIDQSFRYSHHLHRHGWDPEVHVLPNYNHFDILQTYLRPQDPVLAATITKATA
ncbi:alpha/beta hydrolase [Limobrevibacterium gyesilva]|uniref:Alpha/beta hydrolase n=1 Tax=Limobrevibacterium gyesilva TaxID=2991712 RepID=A0AA41YIP4_9PROT|nr:alpha/beta hydrolase [Limobrevibacterium gyesilva]MCW3474329.1 alpha/beta hydrolase [Limobrevibacterium gyesilva]